MPFGTVPVLEVDGVKLPESRAIGSYLSKKFGKLLVLSFYVFSGLNGKDNMEQAQMDALVSFFEGFVSSIQPWISVATGFVSGDKALFRAFHVLPTPSASHLLLTRPLPLTFF